MTARCAPTALGGEGHSDSRITPSISMNNKHLTWSSSGQLAQAAGQRSIRQ